MSHKLQTVSTTEGSKTLCWTRAYAGVHTQTHMCTHRQAPKAPGPAEQLRGAVSAVAGSERGSGALRNPTGFAGHAGGTEAAGPNNPLRLADAETLLAMKQGDGQDLLWKMTTPSPNKREESAKRKPVGRRNSGPGSGRAVNETPPGASSAGHSRRNAASTGCRDGTGPIRGRCRDSAAHAAAQGRRRWARPCLSALHCPQRLLGPSACHPCHPGTTWEPRPAGGSSSSASRTHRGTGEALTQTLHFQGRCSRGNAEQLPARWHRGANAMEAPQPETTLTAAANAPSLPPRVRWVEQWVPTHPGAMPPCSGGGRQQGRLPPRGREGTSRFKSAGACSRDPGLQPTG